MNQGEKNDMNRWNHDETWQNQR